jgi:hypothetical protein
MGTSTGHHDHMCWPVHDQYMVYLNYQCIHSANTEADKILSCFWRWFIEQQNIFLYIFILELHIDVEEGLAIVLEAKAIM